MQFVTVLEGHKFKICFKHLITGRKLQKLLEKSQECSCHPPVKTIPFVGKKQLKMLGATLICSYKDLKQHLSMDSKKSKYMFSTEKFNLKVHFK